MESKRPKNVYHLIIAASFVLTAVFFGNYLIRDSIAQMTDFDEVDITAVVPAPGSGGGSGSSAVGPSTTVTLSGFTAPSSRVIILKDGQIFNTFYSNENGAFAVNLNNQSAGVYNFGLYFQDQRGVTSNIIPLQINTMSLVPVNIPNILIPPTLTLSPTVVNAGNTLIAEGYTAPGATVFLTNSASTNSLISLIADSAGKFSGQIPAGFRLGEFTITAKSRMATGQESLPSRNVIYRVIGVDEVVPESPVAGVGLVTNFPSCVDPNRNGRVNLIDFSIMLFWYEKPNPPVAIDCNSDGVVNLKDFSILMYFWTG